MTLPRKKIQKKSDQARKKKKKRTMAKKERKSRRMKNGYQFFLTLYFSILQKWHNKFTA